MIRSWRWGLSLILFTGLAVFAISSFRSALHEWSGFPWDRFRPDEQRIARETRLRGLNAVIPDFTAFRRFYESGGVAVVDLKKYRVYADELTAVFSSRADGYVLKGYCEYYSGDFNQAMDAFEKAYILDPEFFGTLYNMGMALYNSGLFIQAVPFLEKAVTADRQHFVSVVWGSKVFRDVRPTLTLEEFRQLLVEKEKSLAVALALSRAMIGKVRDTQLPQFSLILY